MVIAAALVVLQMFPLTHREALEAGVVDLVALVVVVVDLAIAAVIGATAEAVMVVIVAVIGVVIVDTVVIEVGLIAVVEVGTVVIETLGHREIVGMGRWRMIEVMRQDMAGGMIEMVVGMEVGMRVGTMDMGEGRGPMKMVGMAGVVIGIGGDIKSLKVEKPRVAVFFL